MPYYAHTSKDEPPEKWQPLEEHLKNVSELAAGFCKPFDAEEWGRAAGMLHDLGKGSAAFQNKLINNTNARVDHSTFGSRIAAQHGGQLGKLLAYVIAGHHGGIPNGGDGSGDLHYRITSKNVPEVSFTPAEYDIDLSLHLGKSSRMGFSLAFFSRMIFSCLVDADFLDTEEHFNPEQAGKRTERTPLLSLKQSLDAFLAVLPRKGAAQVNTLRDMVLRQCRAAASQPRGFFSLTVPTGGGKTLSSLAFALEHAGFHGNIQRIIYAIPFTSIIEQNAQVFSKALGAENVLEHHCNYKRCDDPEWQEYETRRTLRAENWDVPVVVTTNVQFFESLFSNRTSRCRKLHNIADSVIVLDEAQAIPTGYLEPCLAALRELVERYNCTVVLCTATQPALDDQSLRLRLPEVLEIMDDPVRLYEDLRRVSLTFLPPLSDEDLVSRLTALEQILCVVHTKRHAQEIYAALAKNNPKKSGLYHLSTNMYPAHRSRVLTNIRQDLEAGTPCRVISTSLIEAGVDIDFPVVYRAMSGLDSIAQAAGRCNRSGLLPELGEMFVFETDRMPRLPWFTLCASKTREVLRNLPQGAEPLGLDAIRRYFELLYDLEDKDIKGILDRFNAGAGPDLAFPFKDVANAFQLIEDNTIGVIIPIEEEAEKLVRELRYADFPRSTLRKLQQYTVAVRSRELVTLIQDGTVVVVDDEYPVLYQSDLYEEGVGLRVDVRRIFTMDDFIYDK